MGKHFPVSCNAEGDSASSRETPYFVMGLDVEWRFDSETKNAALMQFATCDGDVLLYHVAQETNASCPDNLKAALESKNVLKVGVNVCEDVGKISSRWPGVTVHASIDLVMLEMLNAHAEGLCMLYHGKSLEAFAQHYLWVPRWKQRTVTLSNWELPELSRDQREYAAMDAWTSAAILVAMAPRQVVVDNMVWGSGL
jgi:ribonuclease D